MKGRASGSWTISALLVAFVLPAAPSRAVSESTSVNLAVVVNPAVPVSHLTAAELESIFTVSRKSWPDGSNVSVFSYSPDDHLRQEFDDVVLRMSPEDVARFWLDQRVRGGPRPPRQVPDPLLAVRLVSKLPGSIAYVPEAMVNSTVKVVAHIKAGKVQP